MRGAAEGKHECDCINWSRAVQSVWCVVSCESQGDGEDWRGRITECERGAVTHGVRLRTRVRVRVRVIRASMAKNVGPDSSNPHL